MDSNWTNASVKNIRQQRHLELELLDLERLWNLHLRSLTHQRLGIIYDLHRYKKIRRVAEYTNKTIGGKQLRQYTRQCQNKMLDERASRRRARKFDFAKDPVDRMTLHLPPIDVKTKKTNQREEVSYDDLNRKRANFQKGVNDLEQLLLRVVRRKNRRKRISGDGENDEEDEDEDTDDNEREKRADDGRDSPDPPGTHRYVRQSGISAETKMLTRRVPSPHVLPPILEIP